MIRYTDALIMVFIGLAAFTSQWSIAASSIGIGGLILLTAFRLILKRSDVTLDKNILILFAVYLVMQVISSAISNDPADSFDNMSRKASIYIVFIAAVLFIREPQQLKKLLIALLFFTALISVIELVRFAIDYIPNPPVSLSEYRLQYFGFPLTNGAIKMMILLVLIPLIFTKKNFLFEDSKLGKLLLGLISLLILATFYLTNARNAVLGLFTGLLIYGLLKNRYFLAGLILITLGFLLLAPLPLKERILSIGDINHPSNHTRIVMWETGLKIFKDHPLLGVGDVDINKVYRQYKTPEFHGEGSHMHSNFVQILVNYGIFGLAAWLTLMLYIFYRQCRVYAVTKNKKILNTLAVISISSMAALMVSGLTEWNFGDAEFAAVMWFNLSLAFVASGFMKRGEYAGN
ncbi:MAG: O-antigen ligase family protein [Ignavibacteria bacterium]|nr:O-antigen ligase family protein [Ignavibacteria bacterium]